jgi:CheY-like chemotaxis protein
VTALHGTRFADTTTMNTLAPHTRVLIADDHADAAEMLSALLQAISPVPMVVFVAFDGLQAVRLATRAPYPDVIILDIDMPGMNGIEAAGAIRQALGEQTPELIAVSGEIDRIEPASTVFGHVLLKPVDADHLLSILSSAPAHQH